MDIFCFFFFFFKQKTAYEIGVRLVGSEMCIRDRYQTYRSRSKIVSILHRHNVKNSPMRPIMLHSPEHLCATLVPEGASKTRTVSYTHLRAHETDSYLVCRLLLEKKKQKE